MLSKITDNIFLGEFLDVMNYGIQGLKQLGITVVLNVMERSDVKEEKMFASSQDNNCHIHYLFCPVPSNGVIEDPSSHYVDFKSELSRNKWFSGLNAAFLMLTNLLSDSKAVVLVHCTGGIDRSPFIIAKYLVEKARKFRTMSDAYFFIKKKRPSIIEHPEWIWWNEEY